MNLPTYSEALKMGKEKIKEALIPVRVKRAQKKAELEMLKIEEELATKEAEISEACCKDDVDFPKIIKLQDEIGLLERRMKQYQKILDEMFPDE